ncbi:CobW family GTP-binding protein [Paenibacillus puldeungensis]|uniref:CobW family GTP-binding protein n=1 Tax=Paenibacillus puldeungensis TaxID=696536 RepID=A0ABW3S2I3_9BACL
MQTFEKVPVIILSGFLGSGKTTLLLRMLEETAKRQLRPGILMNEIGQRDVDGEWVTRSSAEVIPMEKLLDGCICCTKKSEIQGAIRKLLDTKPDLLLLELTGVANPEEIVDQLTEPGLITRVYLHRVITLIDAEHALEYNSIFASDKQLVRTLRGQISTADELIINKTDLVPPTHNGRVTEMLRKYNPDGRIHYAVKANVSLAPFFQGMRMIRQNVQSLAQVSTASRSAHIESTAGFTANTKYRASYRISPTAISQPVATPAPRESAASFSRIATICLPLTGPLTVSISKLEHFIKKWGSSLLRAKGYVQFAGPTQTHMLQYSGKRFVWEPSSFGGPFYIVFIGFQLDEQAILEEWYLL